MFVFCVLHRRDRLFDECMCFKSDAVRDVWTVNVCVSVSLFAGMNGDWYTDPMCSLETDSRQLSIVKQRQLNKLKEQEEEQEEAGEVMDRDAVSPTKLALSFFPPVTNREKCTMREQEKDIHVVQHRGDAVCQT